ncbi:MAG: response regulator [Candidatus Omnitrophica bacterium]|nr:response regulator [Candidatus Omnitrophota bacterium]
MVEPKKILIAEDEKEIVELLESVLKRRGFEVMVAFDGEEAKAKITEFSPHIVILDLAMPKVDGWEVLKWLREDKKSNIPAIVISGKNQMNDIKKTYDLDADYYIVKPIRINDLIKGISTIWALKGQQDGSSDSFE